MFQLITDNPKYSFLCLVGMVTIMRRFSRQIGHYAQTLGYERQAVRYVMRVERLSRKDSNEQEQWGLLKAVEPGYAVSEYARNVVALGEPRA